MRSAPPSQGRWNWLHEDRRLRSGSRSSRTSTPPSDGWPWGSLAAARCTRCGQGGTSRYCGGQGRTSPTRSGGARRTTGPGNEKADEWAKLVVEGPDARGVEWLEYSDWAGVRASRSPDPLHTSSGRSRRRRWLRQGAGQEAGPLRANTECRRATGWAARWPGVRRDSLQGSTNRRQVTASPGNTSTRRRIGPILSTDGADTDADPGLPLQGLPRVEGQQKILWAEVLRCRRRVGTGRASVGSRTSLPMGGATRRY